VARALREEEGPAAIAERSLPAVRAALEGSETVLVDGLRSPAEVAAFEDAFGDAFAVVSVEAPFETRAARLGARGRDDSDLDRDALRAREERELGFGMGEVMADADVVVENTGSLAAFRSRVRDLIRAGTGAGGDGSGDRDGGGGETA
jgi:dephospho-CoA kinase